MGGEKVVGMAFGKKEFPLFCMLRLGGPSSPIRRTRHNKCVIHLCSLSIVCVFVVVVVGAGKGGKGKKEATKKKSKAFFARQKKQRKKTQNSTSKTQKKEEKKQLTMSLNGWMSTGKAATVSDSAASSTS